jgi:hypothetical protein
MAMYPAGMANAIYAEMAAAYWPGTPLPPEAEAETKKYYETLSRAIIDYVKTNADITDGGRVN